MSPSWIILSRDRVNCNRGTGSNFLWRWGKVWSSPSYEIQMLPKAKLFPLLTPFCLLWSRSFLFLFLLSTHMFDGITKMSIKVAMSLKWKGYYSKKKKSIHIFFIPSKMKLYLTSHFLIHIQKIFQCSILELQKTCRLFFNPQAVFSDKMYRFHLLFLSLF